MSSKKRLSESRKNTIINNKSKKEDKDIVIATNIVKEKLKEIFPSLKIELSNKRILNNYVISLLKKFGFIGEFIDCKNTGFQPDGGVISIFDKKGQDYFILCSERKNQGTNDFLTKNGKKKQAIGNAIERSTKNWEIFKDMTMNEDITPYVIFLDGCDFSECNTIIYRLSSMFGYRNNRSDVNQIYDEKFSTYKKKKAVVCDREKIWTIDEIVDILYNVCIKSIEYYFNKYGKLSFI